MELMRCRWGILGAGGISEKFIRDLAIDPKTRDVSDIDHRVIAVGSRSLPKAQDFITRMGTSLDSDSTKAYGSYQELVSDPEVDVIYVGTPHSSHFSDVKLCLEANKNVLCEKPMTVNAAQARELCRIAKERGCFLMEAVWTRFFPLTYSFQKIIESGAIGEIERVDSDFSINFPPDSFSSDHRIVNPELAGGALLDLGPYSWTMLALTLLHQNINPKGDSCHGGQSQAPDLPVPKITASGKMYRHPKADPLSDPVDGSVIAVLDFPTPSGGIAQGLLITSMLQTTNEDRSVTIYGKKGRIRIPSPACCPSQFGVTIYPDNSEEKSPEEIHSFDIPGNAQGYMWEADEVARCIRTKKLESNRMPHNETILMMEVFDEIRRQIGLKYPSSIESLA
ncbi:hypothetical protein Pst134EA_007778 [Puccinia striiformis f. sp. tritici]|uniref:D-xylose 1-dehydrogenase (NADP(+), D-xylono-1,5-lactone-forming) n=2 Tax=Puccinia striiformis f. sp. tritici TaxID=168172 RepID=A0A0L0VID5_9BASI|nr:uncharacterized protein Pst134EA_033003 [Puccinia striiformis f. sp. tritici]XP_047809981.1 hypothetical protein Pst134EA_007778 [Puccinia striiformis f. sp. tritici]KAH9440825.1 hypothetical protein Pst134EA_033003 [Puccinia striiformis f. sp. tritici]KAH9470527.1 hypothetical protein Pst134EA_007778 [Puccinia striiformis f. sp. tritici]KNE98961.1 hypothetical protein PSTG_07805 [Puccinia striiformis f. sp. tritici PST-78]